MRKPAAVIGALLVTSLAVLGSLPAGSAPSVKTVYTLSNSSRLLGMEANCTQIVFSFSNSDCSYGAQRTYGNGPVVEVAGNSAGFFGWSGPAASPGFYPRGSHTWDPFSNPASAYNYQNTNSTVPDPNISDVPLTGTLTIDDNGTPGNPKDDLISFDWTVGAAVHSIVTGQGRSAVEAWTSVNEVMAPVPVNSHWTTAAGAGSAGGVDYYICYCARLTFNVAQDSGANALAVTSLEQGLTDPVSVTVITAPLNGTTNPALKASTAPSNPAAGTAFATATIDYTPTAGYVGTDTFTYRVIDAHNVIRTAVVTVNVGAGPLRGPTLVDVPFPTRLFHTAANSFPGDPNHLDPSDGTTPQPLPPAPASYFAADAFYPSLRAPGSLGDPPVVGGGTGPYYDAPSPTGIERTSTYGGNPGGSTTATFSPDYICKDSGFVVLQSTTPPNAPGAGLDCDGSQLLWGAPNSPNNPANRTPPNALPPLNPGWDNVVMKISTDNNGAIVSAIAYYTREFVIFYKGGFSYPGFYQAYPGTVWPPPPDAWQGGVVTFSAGAPGQVAANNDTATTTKNTAVDINVLANDFNLADPITSLTFTQPPNGAVTLIGTTPGSQGTLKLHYVPTAGTSNNGSPTDDFTYTVTDNNGEVKTATVRVTVNNKVPVANAVSLSTSQDTPLVVDLSAITNNKPGDAPATYTVTNATLGAAPNPAAGGSSVTFTPSTSGTGGFDYTITDVDGDTAINHVTITINPPSVTVTGGGPTLPSGGSALDPVTLGLLALGVPVMIRRRRRQGLGKDQDLNA